MAICSYCGKENTAGSVQCRECATELSLTEFPPAELPPTPPAMDPFPPLPAPRLINGELMASAWHSENGFHRVDWTIVRNWIETSLLPADWNEAWSEAALLWVEKLRADLGGGYQVLVSRQSILLCDQPFQTARWLSEYAGRSASTIKDYLGQTAWSSAYGRDVLLIFTELDDYDHYVAHHLAEGENPASGGMCLNSGYTHIALPWTDQADAANAIIHELTHDCLAHLPLPHWLNEAVAVTLERAIGSPPRQAGESDQSAVYGASIGWRPPMMWDELAEQHFAFWNEQNIQTFWAGTSFHIPGESNELSYSLAEVFMKLLSERTTLEHFRTFLEAARQDDAGQTAAIDILGVDLGDIAMTFLGEGNWRPQRTAMTSCWKAAGWAGT